MNKRPYKLEGHKNKQTLSEEEQKRKLCKNVAYINGIFVKETVGRWLCGSRTGVPTRNNIVLFHRSWTTPTNTSRGCPWPPGRSSCLSTRGVKIWTCFKLWYILRTSPCTRTGGPCTLWITGWVSSRFALTWPVVAVFPAEKRRPSTLRSSATTVASEYFGTS